jgi:hypothetical protein
MQFLDVRKNSFLFLLLVAYLSLQLLIQTTIDFSGLEYVADLRGYADLLQSVIESKSNTHSLSFYFSHLPYLGVAHLVSLIGISPIQSLQIVSTTYGMLSIILFVLTIRKILFLNNSTFRVSLKLATFLSIIYLIFPSRNFWIASGLRESLLEFSILLLTFTVMNWNTNNSCSKIQCAIFIFFIHLALWIGISIRVSTTVVIALAIAIYAFVIVKSIRLFSIFLALFLLALIFSRSIGGYLLHQSFLQQPLSSASFDKRVQEEKFQFFSESQDFVMTNLKSITKFEQVSSVRQLEAKTSFLLLDCAGESRNSIISIKYFKFFICKSANVFLKILNAWLLPFFNLNSWSGFGLAASTENIFWLFLFFVVLNSVNPKNQFSNLYSLLKLQIVLFLCIIAQYEGNYGTSFRHKMFLLPLLLLFLLCREFSSRSELSDRNKPLK